MAIRSASRTAATVPGLRRALPRGDTLPADEFARRHRALLALLWLHVAILPLWALYGGAGASHAILEGGAVALFAVAAARVGVTRRATAAALVSLGLLTCSAVVVHLSEGVIEAHFHFFVVMVLLTLYENWVVFLLAAAYVAVHHGIGGALVPEAVYNHPSAIEHPWRWAGIHAGFIAAAGLSAIVAWRLNEDLRDQQARLIAEKQAALERAKAAERELEQRARDLERSNRELEEFASVASHDLREPLTTVSGFVSLLERRFGGRLGPDADEFIHQALNGTRRMQSLIEDLLAYSRVGRASQAHERVELDDVVQEVLTSLRARVRSANAEIVVDPLPAVCGDARQLVRLFQNLISNAVKFAGQATPVVRVEARPDEGRWEVAVVDNGIGIAPADREQIFMMFHRGQAGDGVEGTGLGLAICQRIVERHGGRIWVEPVPGGGSAFRFTLPAAPPGTERQPAAHRPSQPAAV